jgi:ArsR family transcriptional regulator, arsenate/arsenite/antimonite-responsive transcriptional repressor
VRRAAQEVSGRAFAQTSPAISDLSIVFKALSDETRLRILKLLEEGELCVCHIVAAFDMSQSKVSFHLGVLKAAGLLRDRKEGKWMHYRLDDSDIFRRFLIMSVIEKIPGETLRRDKERLVAFIGNCGGTVPAGRCCQERN